MVAAKEKEKVEDAVVEEIDKLVEAKRIIKNRVIISAGLGLVPVPMVDLVGLATIQLEMLARLTKLYEIPFRKNVGKSLIASLVGGVLPVSVVPGTFSLLKAVPLIGWATGAATMSLLGGAATYAVGKVFVAHFEAGGNLLNFDPEAMKEYFAEQFEEGKTVASAAGASAGSGAKK
tara:strand:+ start:1431 stop:1958 length:528 start_codon:yes stop_codon:yes gene_type:complete